MKGTKVLDAYSIIAYLEKDRGYEKMIHRFQEVVEANRNLLLSVVSWGEVYYIVLREYGKRHAEEIEHVLQTLPIDIIPVDIAIAKEAARFKARYKLSYADCFAAALALIHKTQIITGDKEFKTLKNKIEIDWI